MVMAGTGSPLPDAGRAGPSLPMLITDGFTRAMNLAGAVDGSFLDHLYFSTACYTSLGLGDLYPLGTLRLIAGVEALNGLILITWSASFAFLVMQRRWRF